MSLFELEKTLSFDEYLGSFDTERVEKVRSFVDWLAQYQGSLVHNPWGEVNPELEIVTKGFDAAQVRRDNLVAYLLPRLGRAKVFVVAEAVGYQGGRFSGIAITCERMLLDKHKIIRAKDITTIQLERTSSPTSSLLKGAQQKDGLMNLLILWYGVLLLKRASILMIHCCGIYSPFIHIRMATH